MRKQCTVTLRYKVIGIVIATLVHYIHVLQCINWTIHMSAYNTQELIVLVQHVGHNNQCVPYLSTVMRSGLACLLDIFCS